jgi:hypothetical protein
MEDLLQSSLREQRERLNSAVEDMRQMESLVSQADEEPYPPTHI